MNYYNSETTLQLIQAAATLASGVLSEEQKGNEGIGKVAFDACFAIVEARYREQMGLDNDPSVVAL
jgi:hypothetical protein